MIDRPELVTLDLGDTLIRPAPSWAEVYRAATVDAGVTVSRERLAAGFAAALAGGTLDMVGPFEVSPEASYERIRAFDEAIMAGAGLPGLPDTFFRAVAARFADPASWHVFPDVRPALDRLAGAGLRLAVISNWVWDGARLLGELGLADRFEAIVISDRVGYGKPHPAIFRAALDAVGVPAERALHVGDSYRKDVLGASGVGMAAALLVREGEAGPGGARPADGAP
ncbi:MAG TPA: HAD family hydrolase, partial [Candidatus Sulfotelmatobacter sp.]|nr:HAD family hydrolase [Candidatus Sulfotelmatobacter sp.]